MIRKQHQGLDGFVQGGVVEIPDHADDRRLKLAALIGIRNQFLQPFDLLAQCFAGGCIAQPGNGRFIDHHRTRRRPVAGERGIEVTARHQFDVENPDVIIVHPGLVHIDRR